MKNEKATQDLELHDPIKESCLTAEVFKSDNRIKKSPRYGKNRKGLRFISCIDFSDMTKDEVETEVLKHEKTTHYLEGKSPKKIIVVPKRIINIVH